jgi:hypothetical protein
METLLNGSNQFEYQQVREGISQELPSSDAPRSGLSIVPIWHNPKNASKFNDLGGLLQIAIMPKRRRFVNRITRKDGAAIRDLVPDKNKVATGAPRPADHIMIFLSTSGHFPQLILYMRWR